MRLLRALTAALLLVISFGLVNGEHSLARGVDVDSAEEDADAARERAVATDGLLSDAADRQAAVEEELAMSLIRLTEINAELTKVSVELETLRQALAQADHELTSIGDALRRQVVDAYVRAVTIPAASIIGTDDAEAAIVAASSVGEAIDSDQAQVDTLTIKRRQLERLRTLYAEDQRRVAELQSEADAEATHLESLLAQANEDLAEAAATARAADAQYREALDNVDAARAREAERRRQEERQTPPVTTTTTTPGDPTTTTQPAQPSQTTSTTTLPAVEGGTFAPSVERWRPLVARYFVAGRVDGALAVMQCESYGDPRAYNPYSGASGLFQFLPSTWATVSPRAGFGGADVFDAEANIATAGWLTDYYANRGSSPWAAWTCRP